MRERVVAKSIVHHTNLERKKRGLRLLRGHQALIGPATNHSKWMARTGVYSHTGAYGSSPGRRTADAGYSGSVGENIWQVRRNSGKGSTWRSRFRWRGDWQLGKAAVISWMNSPGHSSNMLNPDWWDIGVGVAMTRGGNVYLTQNFGNRPDFDVSDLARITITRIPIIGHILRLFS